ncbi:unnamed protein product [Urochloa humidicola]
MSVKSSRRRLHRRSPLLCRLGLLPWPLARSAPAARHPRPDLTRLARTRAGLELSGVDAGLRRVAEDSRRQPRPSSPTPAARRHKSRRDRRSFRGPWCDAEALAAPPAEDEPGSARVRRCSAAVLVQPWLIAGGVFPRRQWPHPLKDQALLPRLLCNRHRLHHGEHRAARQLRRDGGAPNGARPAQMLAKILSFEVAWFNEDENSSATVTPRLAMKVWSLVGDRMCLLVQVVANATDAGVDWRSLAPRQPGTAPAARRRTTASRWAAAARRRTQRSAPRRSGWAAAERMGGGGTGGRRSNIWRMI